MCNFRKGEMRGGVPKNAEASRREQPGQTKNGRDTVESRGYFSGRSV
jgi:hypothetical protein